MAITYGIAPNPHWVIINNLSRLPAGAAVYTYSSLDPSTFKPAFQDAAGTTPYGQPIVGFGNGTMPPIYWQFDSDNPQDLYYIRVYDSADPASQTFLWDFDGISGQGSGGGGSITINNNTKNLLTNNIFYRNVGDQSAPLPTFLILAPSNNAGYVGNLADANGPASPDIIFAKDNTTATDTITFPAFTPGDNVLGTTPTPTNYLKYACTVAGSGETYKYIQLPIVQGLQNLSGQTVSVKLYSRWNSGENNVVLRFRQFFGNGGSPTADVYTNIGTLAYSGAGVWNEEIFTSIVIPSIGATTQGTCGNSGLFLQILLPTSGTGVCNLDFIKPAVYLGANASVQDFNNYDQIDSIISLPRTGDIRTSLNNFAPYGWVPMNDGTIGSASSNSTTRANIDTFPLFNLIWRTFKGVDETLAPMFTSAGAPVAYGADPFTDFDANRRITLTKAAGRIMAGVSGSHLIGTNGGADNHTNTIGEMAAHTHASLAGSFLGSAGGAFNVVGAGGTAIFFNATTASNGSSTPWDIRQPTVYMNIFIKL